MLHFLLFPFLQVPWGKHVPADQRTNHTAGSEASDYQEFLPVVTVRDPYTWLQSMCRQNYAAQFDHDKRFCPNIVPYPEDIASHPRYAKMKYIPVHIKYDKDFRRKYESLVALWNEWYTMYVNATFPYLLVRMEDLVFHADTVLPPICQCAGLEYKGTLKHVGEVQNRNHGIEQNATDLGLLRSIVRYGNITNRRSGYPQFQLDAARELLSPLLMEHFHYPYEE